MGRKLYIGIDGGGSKTALCAVGEDRRIVGRGKGINYNLIGIKAAAENLAAAVQELLLPEGWDLGGLAIGDPSMDERRPLPRTEEFLLSVREALRMPAETPMLLQSDVYMTLFAVTHGGPGAVIVSGTGMMGMAQNAQGELFTVGGWGWRAGDEGSGYDVALKGVQAALRAEDGVGPPTALSDKLKRYFSLKEIGDLVAVFYGEKEPELAGFGKLVTEAALEGDREAMHILYRTGDLLGDLAVSLLRRAGLSGCPVGYYGGVLQGSSPVREKFLEKLRDWDKTIIPAPPKVSPEQAALELLMRTIHEKEER